MMSVSEQQWCPTSVQVTVQQARGLRAKGKSGTNDAYAVMQVGKEKFHTSVAEKTVAPVWKEEAAFDLPPLLHHGGGGGGGGRDTLHVQVLHRALVGPDKLLGQAVINLLQLSEDTTRNKTEWFKLLDKTGKADKDRGEVLVEIQFMRNNMTASMFDLSNAGKSKSRLGKFKDKVRGKKKESDTTSNVVPSFAQVLTDSEEEGNGDGEVAAGKGEKKKKHKMKSLFSPKSNLQKSMSQSMTVLPVKNSSPSGSQSSGLNMDSSEGKKKFKFLKHKRSGSSDSKDSSSGHQKHAAAEQSNLCINGSHVYCEEPPPRTSRIGSNFSLTSSGHGSMEDVPESSPPSVDSLRAVRQYSPWTEEEEEEEVQNIKEDVGELRSEDKEKTRMEERRKTEEEEERVRRQENELKRLAEEKRSQEEEERRRAEEERVKREEEERIRREEEERRRQEEEEKVRREERLAEEKRRLEEEERRIEEGRKEEEQRIRREKEEKRRQEEEERVRREERLAEEKRRLEEEERRIEEGRKEEEQRIRREKEEKRRQVEEERVRREEEEREEKKRLVEQERTRREDEEERIRMEGERRRQEEEERVTRQEEEANLEEKRRLEEQERKQREEEERIRMEEEKRRREEEERAWRQEEECKLAEEKRRLEEERIEEEKVKKEVEERIRREKEMAEEETRRREEEEMMRRQEEEREEKRRLEVLERRQREEEERIKEEEKAKWEKEEYERLVEEKRKLEEEERKRIEAEEKIRWEEGERMRVEEERRREEEERVRRQLAEEKRIVEEQERRIEEEERKQKEEEERIRKEERERKGKEEKMRQQEEERRRMEEEEMKREEEERIRRVEKERKEEEARMLEKEKLKREAEEQKKKETKLKTAGNKVSVESPAVPSTNPFDENFSNPFEEIPDCPAGPDSSTADASTVQQRVDPAPSLVGNKPVSTDENDASGTQREKRPAPQPPGRSQAEKQSQDASKQHLAQINTKTKDKDIKTVSVPPQRSVQMIAPLSRSPTDTTNTQSLMQSSATKETSHVAKPSKRPAPSRPHSVDEAPSSEHKTAPSSDGSVSCERGPKAKQVPIIYGLNPFEDEEDENAAQNDVTTSDYTGSAQLPPVVSQAADKDAASQTKIKSSKPHAPPLPTKKDATSSTSINQNTEGDHVTDEEGATDKSVTHACDPKPEAVSQVQEAPLQESQPATVQRAGKEAGGKKEGPPVTARRLQPVKPLNPLEQQPVSVVQGEKDNKSSVILQEKTKVNDTGLKGPYSQLTREELISLVLKQESQLSERDKKMSELERYIDNLLVRVMEEKPSILMSLNSLKKAA